MGNLHDISRRISSVASTRKITSTMEMVAKTKIYRSQRRVSRAEPYARVMREMLTNMAEEYADPVPLATPHDDIRHSAIIVITSDRGLCGHFNNDVLRLAEKRVRTCEQEGKQVSLILCGKVAVNFFKHKGYTPIQSFIDQSASPTIEQADAIADYLVEYYLANELDEAFALYNHHHGILSQTPVEWRLMPIDMAAFDPHHVRFSGGISEKDPRLKNLMGRINYEPNRSSAFCLNTWQAISITCSSIQRQVNRSRARSPCAARPTTLMTSSPSCTCSTTTCARMPSLPN